jgi:hypothetical protein
VGAGQAKSGEVRRQRRRRVDNSFYTLLECGGAKDGGGKTVVEKKWIEVSGSHSATSRLLPKMRTAVIACADQSSIAVRGTMTGGSDMLTTSEDNNISDR